MKTYKYVYIDVRGKAYNVQLDIDRYAAAGYRISHTTDAYIIMEGIIEG